MATDVRIVITGDDRVGNIIQRNADQVRDLGNAAQQSGGRLSRLTGVFSTLGKVTAAATAAAGVGLAIFGKRALAAGSDVFETASLIQNSLGPAAQEFDKRIQQMADATNRSRFEIQEHSSTLIAMMRSMGATQEQASELGTTFAQEAVDLGSFFNQADAQVFLDIRAALAGSSETLQKYGIDVRETTLKQIALNKGLIEQGQVLDRLTRTQLIATEIQRQASDAMGDAARTADSAANRIRGIQAVFRDTTTEIGLTFLPIWNEVLGVVSNFARQAGPRLAAFVRETVTNWLTGLAGIEGSTARSFGRTLGIIVGFGQQVVQWGANIVAALAQGISGAISLVISAVKLIGRVIASLLAPGSPPALLPELDTWGTEAVNSWLEGWTQGDFGMIQEVGRQVEQLLAGAGIEGPDIAGQTEKVRQRMAEVVAEFRQTGDVGEDAFNRLAQAAGPAGEAIEGLARRQIELAQATGRVAEIQEQLAAIESRQADIRAQRQLADIQERIAQGGLSASERQQLLLEQRRIELQRQLRTAQQEQDQRQDALDVFKARLGIQQESVSLAERLRDTMKDAANAAGKVGKALQDSLSGAIEGIAGELPTDLGILPNFEDQFTDIRELINNELMPSFEEGQLAVQDFGLDVETALDGILTKLGLIEEQETTRASIFGVGEPGADPTATQSVFDRLGESIGRLSGKMDGLANTIDNLDTGKIKLLADTLVAIGSAFVAFKIAGKVVAFASALSAVSSAVTGAGGVSAALGGLVALLGGPVTVAIGAIALAVGALALAWRRDWGGIQDKTRRVWEEVLQPIFESLRDWFNTEIPEAMQSLRESQEALIKWWDTDVKGGIKRLVDRIADIKEGFEDALDAVRDFRDAVQQWIIDKISEWTERIKSLPFVPGSPPPMELGLRAVNVQLDELSMRLNALNSPLLAGPAVAGGLPAARVGGGDTFVFDFGGANIASNVDVEDMAFRVVQVIQDRRV